MKLFHGSTQIIDKPLILETQRLLDFGKGFYTTSNQNQAERWASIKKRRIGKNANAIVTVYQISEKLFYHKYYNINEFKKADEGWLDFVVANRSGVIIHDYDIVKGPVANDTLYATLSLFEAGILNKKETIIRLRTHKLFEQISFHNNIVLKELEYFESYELD